MKELEEDNLELKKERKRLEFLKRSRNMTKNKSKNLFLTIQTLYSLCEWVEVNWTHEERKELIKEQLKDVSPELVDEIVNTVFNKKLYSKKTNWKRLRYGFKSLFCRFRNEYDD